MNEIYDDDDGLKFKKKKAKIIYFIYKHMVVNK